MNIERIRLCAAVLVVLWSLGACVSTDQSGLTQANQEVSIAATARTVAIGDIHGDFAHFESVLRSTGLVDQGNRWVGGKTILVQLGDSTDRGPDSRRAIDLLRSLQRQAKRAGGKVEVLIGNHEIMNVTGDLRFVHPGEYAAFKNARSASRLDAYYQQAVAELKAAAPNTKKFELPENHREEWNKKFPLGFVAHRFAWSPSGEYGKWTLSNSTAIKVGDTVFVHGGISSKYSTMGLQELDRRVKTEIATPSKWNAKSIIDDPKGPFWYRGWAELDETAKNEAALDKVLKRLGAKRMVIAHTPLLNVVLPRFGGKVVVVDVGMSNYYGGANAALELVGDRAFAIIEGQRLRLPTSKEGVLDYLTKAATLVDDETKILAYKKKLIMGRQ